MVDHAVIQWPGMRSVFNRVVPYPGTVVTSPQQVGVSFAGHESVVLERDGGGERMAIRPGAIFANGSERLYWSEIDEDDEVVEIYPDAHLLREAAGTSGDVEIEPVTAGRDAVVLAVAMALKRAHTHNEPLDDVAASALAHRLAGHLVAYYGGRSTRRPPPGTLDRAQLDRVAELVEERHGDVLSVADLAAAATVSPFHFSRAFKASTGMAPHEFVTARRVERATGLLLRTRMSVADVAYAVGFSNVSHFRRVFRRSTGRLPAQLREV